MSGPYFEGAFLANQLHGTGSSTPIAGLGVFTYQITILSNHIVSVQSQIPNNSSLIITIQQNGTTLGTSTVPTQYQKIVFLKTSGNYAIGDIVTVTLSSTNPVDMAPNAITSIVDLHRGV